MQKQNKENGFTLIELCITLSIVTIITCTGYAFYQHTFQETERKNAQLYLQEIALTLHEHEDNKTGYANLNLTQLGFADEKDHYHYDLTTNTDNFLIHANPESPDICGTLSLDQNGQYTYTGTANECSD